MAYLKWMELALLIALVYIPLDGTSTFNPIVQQERLQVHVDQTLRLNFTLQNLSVKYSIVTFEININNGKVINNFDKDGNNLTGVDLKTNNGFDNRLAINFSQEEQRATLIIKDMQYQEDGMVIRSKLVVVEATGEYSTVIKSTNISVISSPILTSGLPEMNNSQYEINAGELLNFTLIMSGNPQPNVTVILGRDELNVSITKLKTYKYKFVALKDIETKDCGKNFSYTAVNEHGAIRQQTQLIVHFDPKATNLTAELKENCLTINYTLVDPGLCNDNVTYTLQLLESSNTTNEIAVNEDYYAVEEIKAAFTEADKVETLSSITSIEETTSNILIVVTKSITDTLSATKVEGDDQNTIAPTKSYATLSATTTTTVKQTGNTTKDAVLKSFTIFYNSTTYTYCFKKTSELNTFKKSLSISILGEYRNKTSRSDRTKAVQILTTTKLPTTALTTSRTTNTTTTTTTKPNITTTKGTTPQTSKQPTTPENITTTTQRPTSTIKPTESESDSCDDDKKKLVIAMFGGILGGLAVIALIVMMVSMCKDQDKEVEEWDREYLEEHGGLPPKKRVHDFTKESFVEENSNEARRRHSKEKKQKKNHVFEDSCTVETEFGGNFNKTRGGEIKRFDQVEDVVRNTGEKTQTKDFGMNFNVKFGGNKVVPKIMAVNEAGFEENEDSKRSGTKGKKGGSVSSSATSSNISTIVLSK